MKPLNRDQQIEFMERAAERTADRVSRWTKDEVVKSVLTVPPPQKNDGEVSYSRRDKVLACG
ncbi:UNVERIFIED_ORG: vacuolar-type H+-ATPase subunit F/Vma7 [Rhizobium esperanzae]|nr:vacuolar-type H+-ATPase subunit F/Vma7 [Rhizobium esperanzae]